ncbi:MAG: hypothetical protein ABIP33_11465, partial [Pseudolysinimonas sp.]
MTAKRARASDPSPDIGPAARAAAADADGGQERQRLAAQAIEPSLTDLAANPGDGARTFAFWRAVAALPYWIFTPRGDPSAPRPFVVLDEQDRGIILAATSGEASRESALKSGLSEEEAVMMLMIPLPRAIDYVLSFAEHGVHS